MDICKLSLAVADILTGIQILIVVSFNFTWTMNSTPVELIQQQSALQGSPQAYLHFTYLAPTFLYQPAITSNASNVDYSVAIAFMIIFHLLPFMLLTASCVITVVFVYVVGNSRSNNTGTKQSQSSNNRKNKRKLAVLKTIAIMQIGFTATLLPIVVTASLFYSGHLDCDDIAQPYLICFYFSMTNSLVNFIVYNAREREFRNEIVDIFKPGYLKQLSVQSTAETPRKDEHLLKNVVSIENVIETSKTQQTRQTSTSL
ncbi:unnamed protein product [Clavelina lepadiformis]|uniref:G-protein coupled receptors family 1 profile domain-containing protein n=1 Tax=Clavelina lepadiformis TaxID=159417 RepID=A0ABP0G4C1_CLALP